MSSGARNVGGIIVALVMLAAAALAASIFAARSGRPTTAGYGAREAGSPPHATAEPPAAAPAAAPDTHDSAKPAASEKTLTADSTLAEWRSASAAARSQVAVALARNRLAPDANKLDIAKLAMEITGCVSATARDARFDAWKVLPTATTCLTAPERDHK